MTKPIACILTHLSLAVALLFPACGGGNDDTDAAAPPEAGFISETDLAPTSTSDAPTVPADGPASFAVDGPATAQDVPAATADAVQALDGRAIDTPIGTDVATGQGVDAAPAVQTGKSVFFQNGRALGAMVDWGWVAGGNSQMGGGNAETPLTTFTAPACAPGAGALTGFSQMCTDIRWPTANALCMSGHIPAVTACAGGLATAATATGPVTVQCLVNETMDWGEDWGAMIGVQATPAKGSTLTFTPSSIAATFTGDPTGTSVRLIVVIDSILFCSYGGSASYISGMPVTAAGFNSQCWDGGGTTPTSLAGIQKVMLQLDSRTVPVQFTDFCFTGIVFE